MPAGWMGQRQWGTGHYCGVGSAALSGWLWGTDHEGNLPQCVLNKKRVFDEFYKMLYLKWV